MFDKSHFICYFIIEICALISEARAARAFLPPPLLPAPPERISGNKISLEILQEMVSSFVVNILHKNEQRFLFYE
jgi:hypothetical protein